MLLANNIIAALGAAAIGQAAVIKKRSPTYPGTCPDAQQLISDSGAQPAIQSYCKAYLGILTRTATITHTATLRTLYKTTTLLATVTSTSTPATLTASVATQTTTHLTVTPDPQTKTSTVTSSAYLDNEGNVLTMLRRSLPSDPAQPVDKRALPAQPPLFAGWGRAQVSSACNCLGIPTPTLTRTLAAFATGTATATLSRTIKAATTLPTPLTTVTNVNVVAQTIHAPAPLVTATALEIDDVDGCWPDTTETFLCPDGTGADDGSLASQDQLACSTDADDGYSGMCAYWADDSSPAGSTLTMDDPDHPGDPDYQWSRDATYGDSPDDDCPSNADWSCAPNGDSGGGSRKRAVLALKERNPLADIAARSAKVTAKVTLKPSTLSHSTAKPTSSVKPTPTQAKSSTVKTTIRPTSQPKSNGKHPYNSLFGHAAPLRGGKFVPWAKASSLVAH